MRLALWIAALCVSSALIGYVTISYWWYFFWAMVGVMVGLLMRMPGATNPTKEEPEPLTIIDGPWEGEIRRVK